MPLMTKTTATKKTTKKKKQLQPQKSLYNKPRRTQNNINQNINHNNNLEEKNWKETLWSF